MFQKRYGDVGLWVNLIQWPLLLWDCANAGMALNLHLWQSGLDGWRHWSMQTSSFSGKDNRNRKAHCKEAECSSLPLQDVGTEEAARHCSSVLFKLQEGQSGLHGNTHHSGLLYARDRHRRLNGNTEYTHRAQCSVYASG